MRATYPTVADQRRETGTDGPQTARGEAEVPAFAGYAAEAPTRPVLDFLARLQQDTGVTFTEVSAPASLEAAK
jgi:hypothetical protein